MSPQQLGSLAHIGFLMLPNFSMIAFANAVEPLRMANHLSRKRLYRWSLISTDGQPVAASNGLALAPTSEPGAPADYDLLIVCGGIQVREATCDAALSIIRKFAQAGVPLGGVCTGSFALAKAGVMNGYRSSIHWENLSAIREEFPKTQFSSELS